MGSSEPILLFQSSPSGNNIIMSESENVFGQIRVTDEVLI